MPGRDRGLSFSVWGPWAPAHRCCLAQRCPGVLGPKANAWLLLFRCASCLEEFGSETSPGRSGGSPEMGNECSVGKPCACPSSRGKAWLVLVEKSQRSHLGVLLSIPSFLRGQRVWCARPADGGRCRDKEQTWKWCWGNLPPAGRGHGTLLLCWDQPQHYRDPPWAPSPWAPHSPHRTPGLSECFALQELG